MTLLHVSLIVSADTAVETDPACKLGPRIRIGDGPEAIALSLPFDAANSLAFLDRLAATVTELATAITEHGTAYTPAPIPR